MGILRKIFNKQPKPDGSAVGERDADSAVAPGGETAEAPRYSDAAQDAAGEETIVTHRDRYAGVQPLAVGVASHVGLVRQRNEDSALVTTSLAVGDSVMRPFGVFIMADGMGGHSDGEMASQLASRIVAREVVKQVYTPSLGIDSSEPGKPIQDILQESVRQANWQVNTQNPESGTTLTVALVVSGRLYVAHVGDSRAYLLHDAGARVEQLTLDHSFVQRLEDAGQITAEEAAVHPQRNILYRAIGQGDKLEVDTFSRPLTPPCSLLLCSDGLWGVVPPETISKMVGSAMSPQQACDQLVDAALNGGGPDNITVIIARFE